MPPCTAASPSSAKFISGPWGVLMTLRAGSDLPASAEGVGASPVADCLPSVLLGVGNDLFLGRVVRRWLRSTSARPGR